MSSIHALQSSTTREKLLKSVQALRPFLCESLRKSGFDPFEHLNRAAVEQDAHLQTPHYGNEMDTHTQKQNSSVEHGLSTHGRAAEHQVPMIFKHQVPMIFEHDGGDKGNTQSCGPHADRVDLGHNAGRPHQQNTHIGCGHNVIVSDEGNYGLYGHVDDDCYIDDVFLYQCIGNVHEGDQPNSMMVSDDYYVSDLVLDQCTGYGHEGDRPNSTANMLELSNNDILAMLCSLEPSMCPHGMRALAPLGLSSQDDCRFPTEDTLQPARQHHNLYSYTHLHGQQESQQYSECQNIIHEMGVSVYDAELYTHEARCNDNAIPVAAGILVFSPTEVQVSKTTCAKLSSQQQNKRSTDPLPDANAKPNNSLDETDARKDDSNPSVAKASGFSSNLVYERRRRKKFNETLYALRSVVPNVSKMNKTSIMRDALTYAKHLRKRVNDLQNDIHNLHGDHTSIDDEHVQEESFGSTNNPSKCIDLEKYCQSLPKHKILELGVSNMDHNTYQVRISCKKGPGDLLQLTRMIEALNFDILTSNVASIGDQSTINTVVKANIDDVLKLEEVREKMQDIVNKYGLRV